MQEILVGFLGNDLTFIQLEQMERFLEHIEKFLQEITEDYEKVNEKEAQGLGLTDESLEQFYEFYADEYAELSRDFPKLLYSSFVVTWYSFIERELFRLYNTLKFPKPEPAKIFGIYRALKKGNGHTSYTILNPHWERLQHIRKIRNFIVHNHSKIPFTYKKQKKFVNKYIYNGVEFYLDCNSNLFGYMNQYNLIEIAGIPYINPSCFYCQHLVVFGKEFWSKIYQDLNLL